MAHRGLPVASRAHLISRTGVNVLDLKLSPWIVQPFDQQNDYGIDGDVKLTETDPGTLNQKVLGTTFQYQLKSKDRLINSGPFVSIRIDRANFWLGMNLPVMLFLAIVDLDASAGEVFWRCVDDELFRDLGIGNAGDDSRQTVRVRFVDADKFDRSNRGPLVKKVLSRAAAIRPPSASGVKP
jgi:Domain of unknown function (DUF4365)